MAHENWRRYFDFSPFDKNRTNGLCRLCNRNYKDQNGIFSNFLKHLKRIHPFEYDQIFARKYECLIGEKNVFDNNNDDDDDDDDDQTPTDLTSTKYKQSRIILSITKNLIIRCNLPLNLIENVAFRDFMKECNFKCEPISTKKLKRDVIPSLMNKVLKTIYETLNSINHVTLTADVWSDRRCRSFLGITCHFIDNKMMPQAYLLDFLRLKSPYTSENIHQLTEEVLERFNVKEKVFKIITDNASSMIKAYKFGLCVVVVDEENDRHDENLEGDDQSKSIPDINSIFDAFDQDIELNNFQMINVHHDDHDYSKDLPSVRLSCFAHTIQLCIRDGLKNVSYISRVLDKCQILTKFSYKSSKIADLLDELNKHVNKMNITRWNSEYMLIKSILSIGKNDLESITKLMDNSVKFSNNDLIILAEIIDVLEPFYEISIKCQSETIVTVSLVVPAIVHLITHLHDMKGNLSFCTKLVEQLQSSIEKRFAGIIHRLNQMNVEENDPFNDPLYFMAAVLDPSFKFYWIRDLKLPANIENRLKQNIIQLILDEMSKDLITTSTQLLDQSNSSSSLTTTTTTTTFCLSSTPKVKRRKLFSYNDDSNSMTVLDPITELEAYLNDPVRARFSEYWFHSRMNRLKKLIRRIFSVQASSAPVERVFSHAGLILSSRRTNMSEQLFKDLVFLKVNQSLL